MDRKRKSKNLSRKFSWPLAFAGGGPRAAAYHTGAPPESVGAAAADGTVGIVVLAAVCWGAADAWPGVAVAAPFGGAAVCVAASS